MRFMRLPFATLFLILATSAASAETIAGRASVIDGDTLEIHGERIRILDIDAPEKDQFCQQAVGDVNWECGVEATFALIHWIGESDVVCETDRLDPTSGTWRAAL